MSIATENMLSAQYLSENVYRVKRTYRCDCATVSGYREYIVGCRVIGNVCITGYECNPWRNSCIGVINSFQDT